MNRKILEYGGAVAVVGVILLITFLLFNNLGKEPPAAGEMLVQNQGVSAKALSNEIYREKDGIKTEKRRLVPQEIGDSAPTFVYDEGLSVDFQGGTDQWKITFTLFDNAGNVLDENADAFHAPESPGRYLVCEEVAWGRKEENIGMEYYFWLVVE